MQLWNIPNTTRDPAKKSEKPTRPTDTRPQHKKNMTVYRFANALALMRIWINRWDVAKKRSLLGQRRAIFPAKKCLVIQGAREKTQIAHGKTFSINYPSFAQLTCKACKSRWVIFRMLLGFFRTPWITRAVLDMCETAALCVTLNGQFFQTLGSDNRAMGRALDVLWCDLSVTTGMCCSHIYVVSWYGPKKFILS